VCAPLAAYVSVSDSVTILRPNALIGQLNTNSSHFTYPGWMEARVLLVHSGIDPGPPAHVSEHALERLTP